jgi:DNA-binding transcriptional LysR family regulator
VLFEVMQSGTLAKAAVQLRVSQPAVSQVIVDLEHALGVKLFDRSSRGVEPTLYARALLARGRAAFDELRQGIRDIEFLANPTAGELTIAYPESLSLTVLPQIVELFSEGISSPPRPGGFPACATEPMTSFLHQAPMTTTRWTT